MNNLKQIRKSKGLTMDDVAKAIGISMSGYSRIEAGTRSMTGDMVAKLADYFGVSTDAILGRGEGDEQPQLFGRQIVETPEIVPEDEVMIPLVASLRCGPGTPGEPFSCIKPVPVPASYVRRWGQGLQAIIAVGESMIPTIVPGDMLICRPGSDWENGNVVSVNVEDCDMIKRIYRTSDGGVDLRSDNPAYDPIHYTVTDIKQGRLHVLGRVLVPIGREL